MADSAKPPLNHWSTDLDDICEDPASMACVAFCPCAVFARNVKNVTDGEVSFVRACLSYLLVGGCWGTLACLICGPLAYWITYVPCYAARYRRKLRGKRGLPDVPFSDFQAHCLCHPCALAQEFREIKSWHSDIVLGPSAPTVDRGPEETIEFVRSIQEMKR